jgi:cell division protein FtsA
MAKKQRNSIVAVLDIGSSKVVCFIAQITAHNQVEIIGIGHNISQGIKAGRVTDIKAAETSIAQAVEAAEKMAGETIHKVHVSISANNLISQRIISDLLVTGHEINDKDLNRLLFQAIDKYNDQEVEIIHSFAYDYILDGNRGIENPLGMYGNKLSADFHIVSTLAPHLLNITNCIARCQLEVDSFISASQASGLACLTPDELKLGVTLIEFGGGCTSVSVFNRGYLLFTDAVPIGSMHVTSDIARGLSIGFNQAERLKNLYGTALMTSADFDELIEVSSTDVDQDGEGSSIHRSMLVEIIRARVEETIDIIAQKLDNSGVKGLGGNRIVITGGGSQVSGMKEIVGHMLSRNVRVGYPQQLSGLADSTSGIAFTTPVGMLLHVLQNDHRQNYSPALPANDSSPFKNIYQWFRENFG